MDNIKLTRLRQLLFFSVPEAARLIGFCNVRTWRRWESGDSPIPDDVRETINHLVEWRNDQIDMIVDTEQDDLVDYDDCPNFKKYTREKELYFRPYQSVVAECYAAGDVELIRALTVN